MLSVLGFLIILAPLVIVHEFGHFLFAKLFGVKAEVFSVGFGPRLFSKQIGETEFRVSAIPMGGYVKLLGEDPENELSPADKARSLPMQSPWKRFFIFFGGPLFNFLFAIVVFMAILAIGEPQLAAVAGRVVKGSPAERAGLRTGDRFVEVNGNPVQRFDEVMLAIHESPHSALKLKVERLGTSQPIIVDIRPEGEGGYSIYGEVRTVGRLSGLQALPRALKVGISNSNGPAGKLGLKTGDEITHWVAPGQERSAAVSLNSWEQLEQKYSVLSPGSSFELQVKNQDARTHWIQLIAPAQVTDLGTDFGLYSSEMFVDRTLPGSPADKAGVLPGDRMLTVQGAPVASFEDFREAIQAAGEKSGEVALSWERNGAILKKSLVPTQTTEKDAALNKVTTYTIGIASMMAAADPAVVVERVWNPFVLLARATERMVVFTYRNVVSIGKMVTGSVSVTTLGGPILIGKLAGESLSRGLIAFLTTMATLSVGLGILNVLPIPVLDGGHLVLLVLEAIRGRPLSLRQMEILQQVGLSLILLLMIVVMRNDISRLPFFK